MYMNVVRGKTRRYQLVLPCSGQVKYFFFKRNICIRIQKTLTLTVYRIRVEMENKTQTGIGLGVGLYNEKNDKVNLESKEDSSGVVTPVVMLKKGTYDIVIVVSMRSFTGEEEQVKVVVYTSMSGVTLTAHGHGH